MKTFEIATEPRPDARFAAFLGDTELCVTRRPFLDSARFLISAGAPFDAQLVMRHRHTRRIAMMGMISKAARLADHNSGTKH
jgi:hypothetical protein